MSDEDHQGSRSFMTGRGGEGFEGMWLAIFVQHRELGDLFEISPSRKIVVDLNIALGFYSRALMLRQRLDCHVF